MSEVLVIPEKHTVFLRAMEIGRHELQDPIVVVELIRALIREELLAATESGDISLEITPW